MTETKAILDSAPLIVEVLRPEGWTSKPLGMAVASERRRFAPPAKCVIIDQ